MQAKVVLDTNFLMIPYQFGVDIFSELRRVMPSAFEVFVFDKTVEELKKLVSRGAGKESQAAKMALKLLDNQPHHVLETDEFVDDAIVDAGKEPEVYVATMDKEVRDKCPRAIILRQKNHLIVKG